MVSRNHNYYSRLFDMVQYNRFEKKKKKERNYITHLSNPLRTHKLMRSIPVKAGRPVWQTVSCTLKAKAVILNGHWKSEQEDLTGQVSNGDAFLQLLHVETGNVLTDMRSTVWIKHEWNHDGQCCQDTTSHFVQTTTNHCVSFGCKASGFNHSKCSLGGPKSSIMWFSS